MSRALVEWRLVCDAPGCVRELVAQARTEAAVSARLRELVRANDWRCAGELDAAAYCMEHAL